MTDNIRTLQVAKDEPNQDVVTLLENLLAEAKRGEVLGIFYALVRPGQLFQDGKAGDFPLDQAVFMLNVAITRFCMRTIEHPASTAFDYEPEPPPEDPPE